MGFAACRNLGLSAEGETASLFVRASIQVLPACVHYEAERGVYLEIRFGGFDQNKDEFRLYLLVAGDFPFECDTTAMKAAVMNLFDPLLEVSNDTVCRKLLEVNLYL